MRNQQMYKNAENKSITNYLVTLVQFYIQPLTIKTLECNQYQTY